MGVRAGEEVVQVCGIARNEGLSIFIVGPLNPDIC
jgi:hypothetical protein